MIHILPHWNFKGFEGKKIKVWVYTNCEESELFLNGESLGVKKIEKNGHGEWYVEYKPGKLTAIGRNGGENCAEDAVETTGEPTSLKLILDKNPYDILSGSVIFKLLTAIS